MLRLICSLLIAGAASLAAHTILSTRTSAQPTDERRELMLFIGEVAKKMRIEFQEIDRKRIATSTVERGHLSAGKTKDAMFTFGGSSGHISKSDCPANCDKNSFFKQLSSEPPILTALCGNNFSKSVWMPEEKRLGAAKLISCSTPPKWTTLYVYIRDQSGGFFSVSLFAHNGQGFTRDFAIRFTKLAIEVAAGR